MPVRKARPDPAGERDRRPLRLPPLIRVGPLEINLLRRTARMGDATHRLTGSTLRLLYLLAINRGRVVTRDEIRGALWRPGLAPSSDSINQLVRLLRRHLEDDPAHPRFVETVPTRGYRFIAVAG